jgi:hypothetical protein
VTALIQQAKWPILVLAVVGSLYFGMMATLRNVGASHPHSLDAEAYAALFAFATWVALVIFFLIAAIKRRMPRWLGMMAVLLVLISGYSSLRVIGWLGNVGTEHYKVVPTLIAPLLGLYALWAWLPQLQRIMRPLPTSLAIWTVISFLTFAPFTKPALLLYLPW